MLERPDPHRGPAEPPTAPVAAIPRTLVVTNDFPPRHGGVQQYVWNLLARLPADRVAVLAPAWPGSREHDAALPFAVHRWPSTFMWPGRELARRVRSLAREHGARVVLFGHGYPLPALGPGLAAAGLRYVVMTHGAELWMARTPGIGAALRHALRDARAVTAISDFTAGGLAGSVPPAAGFFKLTPAVDERAFTPAVDGTGVRGRLGLRERPVVLCVSRLVPRKGQDVLLRALADVRTIVPDVALLLVGEGPYRGRLEVLARAVPGHAVLAGPVAAADLPAFYAAADVFAMPCRTRWGGADVEGFGIVFLEAAAAGRAVVAGRSGGAAEAVEDGVTGFVTEGREPRTVGTQIVRLLTDRDLAARMGAAGRARVEASFTWDRQAGRLAGILCAAVE